MGVHRSFIYASKRLQLLKLSGGMPIIQELISRFPGQTDALAVPHLSPAVHGTCP